MWIRGWAAPSRAGGSWFLGGSRSPGMGAGRQWGALSLGVGKKGPGRALPRRTPAGFLVGLWQYVFAGPGSFGSTERRRPPSGRVSGWLQRARGWQRSAGPLGCQAELRTLGTPGPHLGGRLPTPPPPRAQALNLAGLHVLFISVGLFSPACESEAINFMAGFNFSL